MGQPSSKKNSGYVEVFIDEGLTVIVYDTGEIVIYDTPWKK
jgi:hypothetical protein